MFIVHRLPNIHTNPFRHQIADKIPHLCIYASVFAFIQFVLNFSIFNLFCLVLHFFCHICNRHIVSGPEKVVLNLWVCNGVFAQLWAVTTWSSWDHSHISIRTTLCIFWQASDSTTSRTCFSLVTFIFRGFPSETNQQACQLVFMCTCATSKNW